MKTAILAANGPSLNLANFDLVNQFDVMILNRGYLHPKIRPKYLVVVNDLVIQQFEDEIIEYCRKNNVMLFSDMNMYSVCTRGVRASHLTYLPDFPHFQTKRYRPLWQGHTVTYVGMQLLYQLGYRRVIIIGLDHYYKRAEGKPTNMKELARGDDPDHFHPDYFKDVYWHTPNLWRSEIAYRLARVYYEWDKRVLANASAKTSLSSCVIKRCPLEKAVNISWEDYLNLKEV